MARVLDLAPLRASAEILADEVFERLDPSLAPTVALVRVPGRDADVEIEPERAIALTRPTELAELAARTSSESGADRQRELRIEFEDFLTAEVQSSAPRGRVPFVSQPFENARGETLSVVLTFDREAFDGYPRLSRSTARHREDMPIPGNLLEAAAWSYLDEVGRMIRDPQGWHASLGRHGASSVLLSAGTAVVLVAQEANGGMEGGDSFLALNRASRLPYEGDEAAGRLLIAEPAAVEYAFTFADPISLTDSRAVRKLLETTRRGPALVSDGARIRGVGELSPISQPDPEISFEVQFTGVHSWTLLQSGRTLMAVRDGEPRLPVKRYDAKELTTRLGATLGVAEADCADICDVIDAALEQAHGTMVVVSSAALAEASRLRSQSTPVTPFKMTQETLRGVSAIDGAVLLSTDATCYAIGVILDGMANERGDPRRGARYNSAVRYVRTRGIPPSVIVCVSEDGMVNIIAPDEPPADGT